jgi:hypothetical protein
MTTAKRPHIVRQHPKHSVSQHRDGTFTDVAVVAGAAFSEDGREQAGMGAR